MKPIDIFTEFEKFLKYPASPEDESAAELWTKITAEGKLWSLLSDLLTSENDKELIRSVLADQIKNLTENWAIYLKDCNLRDKNQNSNNELIRLDKILKLLELARRSLYLNFPEKDSIDRVCSRELTGVQYDTLCLLYRKPLRPLHTCNLYVLFVDKLNKRGVTAELKLDLLNIGTGEFFPAQNKHLLMVGDTDFRDSLKVSQHVVEQELNYWNKKWDRDVRWSISPKPARSLPEIQGASMGAAMTIGLLKLLGSHYAIENYSELDLEGVAVTAAVTREGELKKVDGTWEKLGDQAMGLSHKGLLHTVVVANEQDEIPENYKKPNARPVYAIEAGTVHEAVSKLQKQSFSVRSYCDVVRSYNSTLTILPKSETDTPIETYYLQVPLSYITDAANSPHEMAGSDGFDAGYIPLDEEVDEEVDEGKDQSITLTFNLDDAFTRFNEIVKKEGMQVPRFVVTGPPGSGKSSLMQYIAWKAANGEIVVDGRKRIPVLIDLKEWEGKGPDLIEYLVAKYKKEINMPTEAQWDRLFKHGDVLILLDGLDEISRVGSLAVRLEDLMKSSGFSHCPVILTCRNENFSRYREICPTSKFPEFSLSIFDEEQQDEFIRQYPCSREETYDPEKVVSQLGAIPELKYTAMNPNILKIICFLIAKQPNVSLSSNRTELYRKMVEELVFNPRKGHVIEWSGGITLLGVNILKEDIIKVLEYVSFFLFMDSKTNFSSREFIDLAGKGLEDIGEPRSSKKVLFPYLTQGTGIIRGDETTNCSFLHQTFQEFLAASFLARRINNRRSIIEIQGSRIKVFELLDKKAWDPRWFEVIRFIVGMLYNPEELLRLISSPKDDDHFNYLFTLVLSCIPEISTHITQLEKRQIYQSLHKILYNSELFQHATYSVHFEQYKTAIKLIFNSGNSDFLRDTLDGHLRKSALAVLSECKPLNACSVTISKLKKILIEGDIDERIYALKILGNMGTNAFSEIDLTVLEYQFSDENDRIRQESIRTIIKLYSQQKSSLILDWFSGLHRVDKPRLSEWMEDAIIGIVRFVDPILLLKIVDLALKDNEKLSLVCNAVLTRLSSRASYPDMFSQLTEHIHPFLGRSWDSGEENVRKYSLSSISYEKLSKLFNLTWHEDRHVCLSVLYVISESDLSSNQLDPVVARIEELLFDPDKEISNAALNTLSKLGKNVAKSEILNQLTHLIGTRDFEIGLSAGDTFGKLLESSDPIDAQVHISRLFLSGNVSKINTGLKAISKFASRIDLTNFVPRLKKLTKHDNLLTCHLAIDALGSIGRTEEIEGVRELLLSFVQDPSRKNKINAANAISKLKSSSEDRIVIQSVLNLLPKDEPLCSPLAEVVSRLFGKTSESQIISALVDYFKSDDLWVRSTAARTVKCIGTKALTPEIVSQLCNLLETENHKGFFASSLDTVGALGSRIIKCESKILTQLSLLLQHDEKSVREKTLETIKKLGRSAGILDIVSQIMLLLNSSECHVEAAEALNALMQQGIRIFRIQEKPYWKIMTTDELSDISPLLNSEISV